MTTRIQIGCLIAWGIAWLTLPQTTAPRHMEHLGRGVIAIHQGDGSVFVGWRLLATDPEEIVFNLYRTTGDADPGKAVARRGPRRCDGHRSAPSRL